MHGCICCGPRPRDEQRFCADLRKGCSANKEVQRSVVCTEERATRLKPRFTRPCKLERCMGTSLANRLTTNSERFFDISATRLPVLRLPWEAERSHACTRGAADRHRKALWPLLRRSCLRCLRHLDQFSGFDIVHVPVHRNASGDERMRFDPDHVLDNAFLLVADRQPLDVISRR